MADEISFEDKMRIFAHLRELGNENPTEKEVFAWAAYEDHFAQRHVMSVAEAKNEVFSKMRLYRSVGLDVCADRLEENLSTLEGSLPLEDASKQTAYVKSLLARVRPYLPEHLLALDDCGGGLASFLLRQKVSDPATPVLDFVPFLLEKVDTFYLRSLLGNSNLESICADTALLVDLGVVDNSAYLRPRNRATYTAARKELRGRLADWDESDLFSWVILGEFPTPTFSLPLSYGEFLLSTVEDCDGGLVRVLYSPFLGEDSIYSGSRKAVLPENSPTPFGAFRGNIIIKQCEIYEDTRVELSAPNARVDSSSSLSSKTPLDERSLNSLHLASKILQDYLPSSLNLVVKIDPYRRREMFW